ncbi:MAG: alpha/beta hydrolase [Cytophagales bacterium]|nr:alpha/beta hydrolase [Cytophagales bacterium]
MPVTKLYFVSGLGADERVFQFLELPGFEQVHIHWVPTTVGESLGEYCKKLSQQIDILDDIVLIGVSFGGLVVQELAKIVPAKKVIIISSLKSVNEFGWDFKLLRWIRLDRLIPTSRRALEKTHGVTESMFGVKTVNERKILREILHDIDPQFLKWAVGAMMEWKQKIPIQGLIHIHGTNDKVFPSKHLRDFIPVEGGGHLMLLNRAHEISKIIKEQLSSI